MYITLPEMIMRALDHYKEMIGSDSGNVREMGKWWKKYAEEHMKSTMYNLIYEFLLYRGENPNKADKTAYRIATKIIEEMA